MLYLLSLVKKKGEERLFPDSTRTKRKNSEKGEGPGESGKKGKRYLSLFRRRGGISTSSLEEVRGGTTLPKRREG